MSFWTWAHGGQESGFDKSVRPQSTHQVRGQNSMVFQLWDFQGWLRGDRNDGRNVQNIHRRSFLSYWSSVFPTPRAPHFFEALSHPSSIVPGRPLVGKLFFLSIHCQNYVTKNKDQSKGKYKIKKPLFITTIKVCILNIIQNISQGATWMMGCACKRQTPHTPRETDRLSAFSGRNKPILWDVNLLKHTASVRQVWMSGPWQTPISTPPPAAQPASSGSLDRHRHHKPRA